MHDSTARMHITTPQTRCASSSGSGFLLQAPRRPIATPITSRAVGGSVHLPDKLIDVLFPVTMIATLYIVLELACSPATVWVGQLEGPQEVGSLWRKA